MGRYYETPDFRLSPLREVKSQGAHFLREDKLNITLHDSLNFEKVQLLLHISSCHDNIHYETRYGKWDTEKRR